MRNVVYIITFFALLPEVYLANGESGCHQNKWKGIGYDSSYTDYTEKTEYNDSQGSLSPDGDRMVFVSDRNGNDDLYLINLDGSNLLQLTSHKAKDFLPHWSPDGQQIVFTSGRDDNFEIYKVNADGTGLKRLTDDPQIDEAPKWSPDGTQIAFFSLRKDGNPDLYIMNKDGSGLKRLTSDEGVETFPNWSPYGNIISFTKVQLPERNPAIFTVDLKTGEWTKIYDSPHKDFGTAWVSENRLAFYSDQTGNFEIYLVNKNGSGLVQLTESPANDTFPVYGPDADSIIFTSDRSGVERIYRLNIAKRSVEMIKTS